MIKKLKYKNTVGHCPRCEKPIEIILEEWDNNQDLILSLRVINGKTKFDDRYMEKHGNDKEYIMPNGELFPYYVTSNLVHWSHTQTCHHCGWHNQYGWDDSLHVPGGGEHLEVG